jgi:hypothetical protein
LINMIFRSDKQRKAVFAMLNRFSMKDDVKKLVAMGVFPRDPETRAAVDALDDAENVGGDAAVREQTVHIIAMLVPENDQQENIVQQLKMIAGAAGEVPEGFLPEEVEEQAVAPVMFSAAPATDPETTEFLATGRKLHAIDGAEFESEMQQVEALEKQIKAKVNELKREEKKAGLIDDVVGAIDSVFRDPTPMEPEERDLRTRQLVHDILDRRLKGDRIIGGKK